MDQPEYQFYNGYEPNEEINERLDNTAEEDIDKKVPYRDLLGILDEQEAYNEDTSLTTKEIEEIFLDWISESDRSKDTPSTQTIRNKLDDMHDAGIILANKTQGQGENKYHMLSDNRPTSQHKFFLIKNFRRLETPLETVLCRHVFVSAGVVLYILSSILYMLSVVDYTMMIPSGIVYIIGHLMAYRDEYVI